MNASVRKTLIRVLPAASLGGLLALGTVLAVSAQDSQTPKAPERLGTGVDISKLRSTAKPPAPPAPAPAPTPAPAVDPHDHSGTGTPAAPGLNQGTPPAPPVQTGPAPNLVWEDGEKDFGELIQGQMAEHTFKLHNGGEGDLIITQIKPSCGCTAQDTQVIDNEGQKTAYVTGTPIKPGSKIEVKTTFNSHGKRDQVHGQITIYCNDPRTIINLTFKALVKLFMSVEPTYLNLESMSTTDVKEGMVTVKSSMVPRFKLSTDARATPEMHVDLRPKNPDESGAAAEWEVHVKLGPDVPEGTYSRQLALKTDQPMLGAPVGPDGRQAVNETQVMVMAQVKGLVSVEPMFVSYGMMRPGQVVSRTLRLVCNDPAFNLNVPKITLTNLKGEPFEYEANMSKPLVKPVAGQEGKAYDIELTVNGMPETLNGNFMGSVNIETGHPSKPKIEVRFTGVCRAGANVPQPLVPGIGTAVQPGQPLPPAVGNTPTPPKKD